MSKDVNRGLAWISLASTLVGVLDIVATLVILNLWVDDEQYGIATKAIWIFPILDQATEMGLSAALIQRDDHTESKTSTIFWINVIAGIIVLELLLLATPVLAGAYPIVGLMLLVYGSKLILQNLYLIPVAMMKRQLRFKELSMIRIVANFAEFGAKIGLAYLGFGIWCFVLWPLSRILVTGIGAQICHPWRPRLICNLRDARAYIGFGLKSSGSQLLFYFYTNIDFFIVGHFFGAAALGIYKLACEIVLEPVRIISYIIVDIAFPAFAKLRHKNDALVAQFVSFMRLNLITVMSYSLVVMIAAPELIAVLFPDYGRAVPAIRILCAVAVLRSISYVIPPLLDGVGRPDRTFRYMLTAAIVLPLFYVGASHVLGPSVGMLAVPIAWAVGYPLAFAVLLYFALRTLNIGALALLRQVGGVIACLFGAAVAALAIYLALAATLEAVRLVATIAVYLVAMGLLLAYTQGISIRTIRSAMSRDDA
jgi:O-antigen/teichoic acid export membrane protein